MVARLPNILMTTYLMNKTLSLRVYGRVKAFSFAAFALVITFSSASEFDFYPTPCGIDEINLSRPVLNPGNLTRC